MVQLLLATIPYDLSDYFLCFLGIKMSTHDKSRPSQPGIPLVFFKVASVWEKVSNKNTDALSHSRDAPIICEPRGWGNCELMIYNLANLYYVFFKALLFQVKFADVFKDRGYSKNELLFVDCSSLEASTTMCL